MKRISIILILSLVMCLIMSFPASSATITLEDSLQLALNKQMAGFTYKAYFYVGDTNATLPHYTGILVMFFKTSTPKKGDNFAYFMYGLNGSSGGDIGGLYLSDSFLYNVKFGSVTYPIAFRYSTTPALNNLSNLYFCEYLEYISTAKINFIDSNYYGVLDIFPDISALQALLTQAKAIQNTGYTQSSWDLLQLRINEAANLLATTGYTQEQINSAKNALQAAIDGLILRPPLPNISELEALLIEADAIEDIGYTSLTWNRFETARSSAHVLVARTDYTQSEVSYAVTELRSSMNGLTFASVTPPPITPPALGYDLSTGNVSGYLNVVPRIFFNYVRSAWPVAIGLFGVVISILIIPRIFEVIFRGFKR